MIQVPVAYPNVRLSKKKFLVLENDHLYHGKIKEGQALYTPIAHRSEIRKLSAQMIHSRNGTALHIYILPQTGNRRHFLVHSKKLAYKQEDWVQIDEFFRDLDFLPSPVPEERNLRDAQTSLQVNGLYRYFPVGDRIFELGHDPVFKQELESQRPKFLSILLVVFGFLGLIGAVVLGIMVYEQASTVFWILSVVSLAFLGCSIPQLSKNFKKHKNFIQKYDLAYFFK
ncbi:MAG: hypothetical protein ACTSWW_06195 [Promethearchaeota archaeon]